MEDSPLPALGEEVGGYRLEARLGEGGQGTVYRARREGQLYALKFRALARSAWPWRELEVGLRLRLGGEVTVLGYGLWPQTEPSHLFLIMPYVNGRSLEVWVRTKNPSARKVVLLLLDVAWQLLDIHRAGVVHRDIKAANVLVRDEDGRAVLVDFGVGTYTGAPHVTHPLALPGTPLFRSPEALRFRREHAGEHAPPRPSDDLWAMGVLLYWLLTNSYPFETQHPREDEGGLANRILRETPEPPHERNPRVPRALGELCLRMLEKPLEARLPDAQALCEELETVLEKADDSWDEPLCEPWGPDAATTIQERELDLGDWADREQRLKEYARRHARRGEPLPPEETPAPPPRTRRLAKRVNRVVAGLVLTASLLALMLALPHSASTSRVTTPGQQQEGSQSAAPDEAFTPAPVADAATPKDNMLAKTPRQTASRLAKACGTAWAVGQLACATPPAPAQLTSASLPPPAECPPGAWDAMSAIGIKPTEIRLGTFLPNNNAARIVVPPGTPVSLIEEWGQDDALPQKTVFMGELFYGAERAYGRFTQARTPQGKVYPVCMELVGDELELQNGEQFEPGSKPGAVKLASTVYLRAVERFD
ncbi:serine/threonine protein kinase [Melittangium boletus]|uniref:serine/threonine protein kinase n=1 Tax=Melittangium boletus TaxID=83453 RepID=UPI001C54DF16|nr:serine/threonine-protein kinase [Melittangium boletus]